jgi:hypothetical protein
MLKILIWGNLLTVPCLYSQIHFQDVGVSAGVETGYNSHGSGFFDYNNDGYADLFIVHNVSVIPEDEREHGFFENQGNGTFTYVTDQAGVGGYYTSAQGLAAGDYNNDGNIDICIGMGRNYKTLLYRNNGNETFSNVSTQAGVNVYNRGRCLSFVDYNNDGWVDLFVPGDPYLFLYKNNKNGTFSGVTNESGLEFVRSSDDIYGHAFGDVDNDGDMDLFIPSLVDLSRFFINNGDGTFTDATVASGLPTDSLYYGAVFLDYNNDGYYDLFTRRKEDWPELFRNNQDGTFTDVSIGAGIYLDTDFPGFGGGLGTADFDNDGYVDILVLTKKGYQNRLFHNNGNGTFTNIGSSAGVTHYKEYWSAPIADYDHDGYLDIYFCRNNIFEQLFKASLYRNDGGENNWLHINLEGNQSNRLGIGARLVAYTNGNLQMRQVMGGEGYKVDDFTVEFGLGSRDVVDSLVIYWPSGIVQNEVWIPANQIIDVTEQEGTHYYQLFSVSGMVRYLYGDSPVPEVPMVMSGAEAGRCTTAVSGLYTFYNLSGGGSITVIPDIQEGEGMASGTISAYDASLTARNAVGLETLTVEQQGSADVNQNGEVDMFDAALTARYAVGFANISGAYAGTWKFEPASHTHAVLSENIEDDDFTASILGDVDGNWGASVPPEKRSLPGFVPTGYLRVVPGQEVVMPVVIDDGLEILSADIWVRYDPEKVDFVSISPSQAAEGFQLVHRNSQDGELKIAMYGMQPLKSSGPLMILKFRVSLIDGEETEIVWDRIQINGKEMNREILCLFADQPEEVAPGLFGLEGNYPNPFNPGTAIRYRVGESGQVSLIIYDTMGRSIRNLVHRYMEKGSYQVDWSGDDDTGKEVPSGIYICKLVSGNQIDSIKLMKLK